MNNYKLTYTSIDGVVTTYEETSDMPANRWKFTVGFSKVRPTGGMSGGQLDFYINGELQLTK